MMFDLLRRVRLDELEMHAGIAKRLQDGLAERHLFAQRGGVSAGLIGADDDDLARAIAHRTEQRVQADGGDMETLERDGTRRQAPAAANGAASDALKQRSARPDTMEYDAGILAASLAIGAEQRLQPPPDIGD